MLARSGATVGITGLTGQVPARVAGSSGSVGNLVDDLLERGSAFLVLLAGEYPLERTKVRGPERLVGRYGDIGDHASALPVLSRHRIHRPPRRHPHAEVLGDPPEPPGMRAAPGGVTHDLAPPLGLHIVREFLRPGEGAATGQHVNRFGP